MKGTSYKTLNKITPLSICKRSLGKTIQFSQTLLNSPFHSEGSQVALDCMIFWRISDSEKAAKNAMELLKIDDQSAVSKKQRSKFNI